jgi:predicted lipoprotein with Yx(FWY)xxD motif
MRPPWADRRRRSWHAAALSVAAATLAVACGHSPGTTAATILAIQPVSTIVSGTSETVLEGDLERSLYYSSSDTSTSVTCQSTCTETWVPFLKPVAPLIGSPFPNGPSGTLTWMRGSDGCQAEYNGHPLYTYAGDVRPAEATGNGLHGIWYVVTPDLAPAAGWVASEPSSC